uniref:LipA n=1 Tax=Pseudomonas sp. 24 TaxID=639284 RepID=C3VIF1_9PSED|nr:LipA [Pseudomonas sp. 24]
MQTRRATRAALGFCALTLVGLTTLSAPVQAQGYTETRHPIVLVHGLAGYDNIGPLIQYFNGVPETLTRYGASVHVAHVAASNATEIRGEQLLAQVEDILAITGAQKVNLIGHSHGSMTARYVAGVRPDLVASVTSAGGVNWGSAMADVLGSSRATMALVNAFSSIIDTLSGGGYEQDARAAARQMSTAGARRFNRSFPAGVPPRYCANDGAHEVDGVRYYSWGGDRQLTNVLDITDGMLMITGQWFGEPNDGVVSVCSQRLGRVISVNYPMNHLDVNNQVAGLVGLGLPHPLTVWRQHANRLRNAGL